MFGRTHVNEPFLTFQKPSSSAIKKDVGAEHFVDCSQAAWPLLLVR
jgi:hypothetical protein